MERPPQRYFCNKCGYVGNVDLHPGCGYLAYHLAPFEQNYIDQLEKELADIKKLATSPASAPEGWKIVPVEPTQAMSEAAMSTFIRTSAHETEIDVDVLYHAMIAAAPTPPENKAPLEAVAEVVWYDPQLSHFPEKPGKIIDGSIAFMESAEIGTKLFPAPTTPVSECVDPVMTKEELIAAAESIGMRFTGATIPPVSEDRNKLELYGELLYAVANKFPGESRHQTALRYIRNAEKGSDNAAMQEDKP